MRGNDDIDRELQCHIDERTADLLAAGVDPEAARRRARLEFGGVLQAKEAVRDLSPWWFAGSVWQDVRYAVRTLRGAPLVSAIALLTLALSIGANTAVFSLVNTLMLRQLPVREPAQLVELVSRYPGDPDSNSFAWRFYEYYRDRNHVFADLIGTFAAPLQLNGNRFNLETLDGEYVVGRFFPALGIRPAMGRLLDVADDRPGQTDYAAVASWALWKKRFNLDPAILGTRLVVNNQPVTIVGVADERFAGLEVGTAPDLWLPTAAHPALYRSDRPANQQLRLKLMGRLSPGVSIDRARAEMSALDAWRVDDLAKAFGNPAWRQARIGVEPAASGFSTLRAQYGNPLLTVMAIVALLSLLACANVASLLLVRGAARQREMAVRVALGAGRARLVRQLLTESLLLSIASTAAGVLVAYAGTRTLIRIMTSGRQIIGLPQRIDIHVAPDARVLFFMVAMAVVTALLFGLAPACEAFPRAARNRRDGSGPDLSSLRTAGAATDTISRRRIGRALVVAQVALSLVLLSGAALLMQHLSTLRNEDVGFRRDSVLLVALNPQGSGLDRDELSRRYQELLARIHAIPGVRAATVSGVTPIQGAGAARFAQVEGVVERPEDRRYASLNWVGPRYFETLGTPFVAGRDFAFDDVSRPRVAIVNAAFARHYFGAGSAIGKHVAFDRDDTAYEIVGVVGNAKYLTLHRPPPPTVYLHAFQEPGASQFAVRTSVAPTAVANDVRRAVQDVLKTVRVTKVTTLSDQVDASIVPERLMATLSSFFGSVGMLLAALGVYGLLAYTVSRRTSEIGIRIALGATERDVMRMVLSSAALLVGSGLVVGLPVAIWSLRIAAATLETRAGTTLAPAGLASLVIVSAALLAAWLPARRAARVDPAVALRGF
jgi:predicted permease